MYAAKLVRTTELPFSVSLALRYDNQAQFHPLKFLDGISKKLRIYEDTSVLRVENHRLYTDSSIVDADNIVFAAHYPFVNFPGLYFMRLHQERSCVLALEDAGRWEGMYLGIDKGGLSFRGNGDLTLMGGNGYRTGENKTGGKYEMLMEKAQSYWPECRPVAQYSAQDCFSLDGVPYIGRYSKSKPYWYVATGFQKWGMTTSMVAANLIGAQIAGETLHGTEIFSPRRFTASAIPKLGREAAVVGKSLIKSILYLPGKEFDTLPRGQGGIIRHCGKKRGAFRDEAGTVYLVSVKCPHLGCQLEWNQDERSWDCPCHGSRFDYKGRLITNPAQKDIKV